MISEAVDDLQDAEFKATSVQRFEPDCSSPWPTITGAIGTEISSSVSLFYQEDWARVHNESSSCFHSSSGLIL